jgi:hypothetical protein
VVLFLGRAGSSHWSASIEIDEAVNSIRFDVACRLHERPEWLGSTYLVPRDWVATGEGLVIKKVARLKAYHIEWKLRRYEMQYVGFYLPAPAVHPPYPQTVRWQYWLYSLQG